MIVDNPNENAERKGKFPDPNQVGRDGRDWKFNQSDRRGVEGEECEPVVVQSEPEED